MNKLEKFTLTVACAIAVLILFYSLILNKPIKLKELDTSDRQTLKILFIGNSYTFFNEMPRTLENLAKHDPSSPFIVETEMLVEGGATLAYFLNSPNAKNVLNSEKWDYIVLQPQSEWTNSKLRIDNTERALSIWHKQVKKNGTRLVLFMTWARQPNVGWYKLSGFSQFKNHQTMHNMIKSRSVYLAKKHNMMLAPVGDYWAHAVNSYPNLRLYNKDGSHPSPEGSFLIAFVFYKMLVDSTLEDIAYWPSYINTQEKNEILGLVSKNL